EIEAGPRHRRVRASRLQSERCSCRQMHAPGDDDEKGDLMRSLLFVPGDSEKKLEKGFGAGADVVIVDLEDSVAPQDKVAAREIAARFIAGNRQQTSSAIYIRVNELSTGLTDDDLAVLVAV